MKFIISSDRLAVINVKNIHTMKVDISTEGYPIVIDGIEIAYYTTVDAAKKSLEDVIRAMHGEYPIEYQMEDK